MTVSEAEKALDRLPHRCWVIADVNTEVLWDNGDYVQHFARENDAWTVRADLSNPSRWEVKQQSYTCIAGPDCSRCDNDFEGWMAGGSHCTPTKAQQEIESQRWKWTEDGWICPECAFTPTWSLPQEGGTDDGAS